MRILHHKNAVEAISDVPFWMFFVFAVGITSIVLVYMGNSFVEKAAEIPITMEDELTLSSRFYNSQNCFAYTDNSGAVYLTVIDFNRFNQETMAKCFMESNVKYAFSLSLEIPKLKDFESPQISTFNWEEDYLATKKIGQDVLILYNNAIHKGRLIISIKNV
jgi:hypothetical protein